MIMTMLLERFEAVALLVFLQTPYLSGGAPEALVVQKGSFPSGYTPIVIREVLPSLRDRRRILLSFRVEPPSIVVEGDSLTAFGINVLDSSGAPVEGVRVIATVAQVSRPW